MAVNIKIMVFWVSCSMVEFVYLTARCHITEDIITIIIILFVVVINF